MRYWIIGRAARRAQVLVSLLLRGWIAGAIFCAGCAQHALVSVHNNDFPSDESHIEILGASSDGTVIRDRLSDGSLGPAMVVIPAGSFMMGSPRGEYGRYEDEGPQHEVKFAQPFLMARTPITVAQFRVFVESTGYKTEAQTQQGSHFRDPDSGFWRLNPDLHWQLNHRGEPNGDDYPVVHVSWNDVNAYVAWLSEQTGYVYRLPSEAEFEYSNRAGSNTVYWWGNGSPVSRVANLKGDKDIPENDITWFPTAEERQFAYANGYTPILFEAYGDGYWGISPVASFPPNQFGVYDTTGNIWEWTADCWHGSYHGAPTDGSAWLENGTCSYRVVRGGSYYCFPRHARSANRWNLKSDYRGMYLGFRVVRDVAS